MARLFLFPCHYTEPPTLVREREREYFSFLIRISHWMNHFPWAKYLIVHCDNLLQGLNRWRVWVLWGCHISQHKVCQRKANRASVEQRFKAIFKCFVLREWQHFVQTPLHSYVKGKHPYFLFAVHFQTIFFLLDNDPGGAE